MNARPRPGRGWRRVALAAGLVSLLLLAWIGPHMISSTGLVKLRNALLVQPEPAQHDWTPAALPGGFRIDHGPVPAPFAQAVEHHGLHDPAGDWATALAIARHLLSGGRTTGGPIMSDLLDTYTRIVERGEGYCGDYADAFTALGTAAGLFVRSWAFSFDGFGGHGHIFNEVWDSQAGAWRMLDVHSNVHPVDPADARPLAAVELRERMLRGAPVRWEAIEPATRLGFPREERLLTFYRDGLPQWYLWWGSNLFEYDAAAAVRLLAPIGRSAEQLGGIVTGAHRGFRVLAEPGNAEARGALQRLRWPLLLLPATLTLTAFALWMSRRAGRGRAVDARQRVATA